MRAPRVMLAGIASGSGKTLVTCGLLKAFQKKALRVQAFKCGPDYIDPMFHRSVLKTDSCNLDPWFLERQGLRSLMAYRCREKDVAVMEGVMGYYDGIGGTSDRASSYEVAAATDTPVVLVVPCKGMSKSIVPLLRGFAEYRPDSRIRGVVFNRVGKGMYPLLKRMVEEELADVGGGQGIRVLGYVPELQELPFTGRHLGLVLPEEIPMVQKQLEALGEVLSETLDLQGFLELAQEAPEIEDGGIAASWQPAGTNRKEPVRIGVARDEAFCFLYPENLQILKACGAKPVFFSPLRDQKLPEGIAGLLLCGGYPELHAEALESNEGMRLCVKEKLLSGMPALAECGGFLYLLEHLYDPDGKQRKMAGVLKGEASSAGKLVRFGYVEVTARQDSPFLKAGESVRAHEFHYWDASDNGAAWEAVKASGKGHWPCMRQEGNILAGFPHLYYGSNPGLAENFADSCRAFARKGEKRC